MNNTWAAASYQTALACRHQAFCSFWTTVRRAKWLTWSAENCNLCWGTVTQETKLKQTN